MLFLVHFLDCHYGAQIRANLVSHLMTSWFTLLCLEHVLFYLQKCTLNELFTTTSPKCADRSTATADPRNGLRSNNSVLHFVLR